MTPKMAMSRPDRGMVRAIVSIRRSMGAGHGSHTRTPIASSPRVMRTNRLRKLTNLAEITRVYRHGQGIEQDLDAPFRLCRFHLGDQAGERTTLFDLDLV